MQEANLRQDQEEEAFVDEPDEVSFHQDELVDAERPRLMSEPQKDDSDRVFQAKKARLIARVVPMTLVPLSSANGMLVIGSGLKKTHRSRDCYFGLMEYLLFGGAISLSLVVLAVVSKHMLGWVLYDNNITPTGRKLLKALRYLGTGLAIIQLAVIIVGTAILFPQLPNISYDKKDKNYCQEGAVVFTTFLLSMCWLFIIFGAVCYCYIFCCEGRQKKRSTHRLRTSKSKVAKPYGAKDAELGVPVAPGPLGQAPPSPPAGHRSYVLGTDYPPESSRSATDFRRPPPTYQESISAKKK